MNEMASLTLDSPLTSHTLDANTHARVVLFLKPLANVLAKMFSKLGFPLQA